ncbi:MAG: hypothetical protein RL497_2473 [Pseudomonadota bacterium]
MSQPESSAPHKDKNHLVAELEALQRSLAPQADIPVLVEAVLDSEDETPDLAVQIDLVDSLLADDKPALTNLELQLDLGYDLLSAADTPLPEDPGANESLSQIHNDPIHNDPINYTGDDLFINHEDRESHFSDPAPGLEIEDPDEPPLLELDDALPESAADKLNTVFQALSNPTEEQDDENPFLPAHLREKLRRSKASLIEEIQRSSDAVHQSSALIKAYTTDTQLKNRERPATTTPPPGDPNQALIDELVAEFLPKIEAKLRQRLAEQLADKPLRAF